MVCKVCGNLVGNQTHIVREMMFGLGDCFTYIECSRCGCVQLHNPPADMSKYYPRTYYSFSISPPDIFNHPLKNMTKRLRDTYSATNRSILGKVLYARFPDYVVRPLALTGVTKRSRILDVGCGSGWLLYTLRNAGFRNLLGIDPYIDATIEYKNGLTIRKQSIHEVDGEWDLILLDHAFEHVPDPLETLRSMHRLLSVGGMGLIRIPIASSYAWRHYKTNWVQLDAPRHYFLHTTESMRLLANNAGLNLEHIVYDSTEFQFWGSEQYMRGIPLEADNSYRRDPSSSVFMQVQIEEFRVRAQELNDRQQGDQAAFYLRSDLPPHSPL
jgi:2-polyprenyl-3-methyl-5-hydroxy-6-metoxy-1,4-benzoquinol methylase